MMMTAMSLTISKTVTTVRMLEFTWGLFVFGPVFGHFVIVTMDFVPFL
jgi:hypothetical protein